MEIQIDLKRLIIWSDGCASQFHSKFVFRLLSLYKTEVELESNCNEGHHSKGFMSSIGGTVEKLVFRKVKAEKAIINLAKEFCEVKNCVISIMSLYQSKYDIMKEPDDMERSSAIPNTLSIHKVERKQNEDSQTTLEFLKLSISPKPFVSLLGCGHVEVEN